MKVYIDGWSQTDEGSPNPMEAAKAAIRSCCGCHALFDSDVTKWDTEYHDNYSGKTVEVSWSDDEAEAMGGRTWLDAIAA